MDETADHSLESGDGHIELESMATTEVSGCDCDQCFEDILIDTEDEDELVDAFAEDAVDDPGGSWTKQTHLLVIFTILGTLAVLLIIGMAVYCVRRFIITRRLTIIEETMGTMTGMTPVRKDDWLE